MQNDTSTPGGLDDVTMKRKSEMSTEDDHERATKMVKTEEDVAPPGESNGDHPQDGANGAAEGSQEG